MGVVRPPRDCVGGFGCGENIDVSIADLATFMQPTLTVIDATRTPPLIRAWLEICLLRRAPQDLPAEQIRRRSMEAFAEVFEKLSWRIEGEVGGLRGDEVLVETRLLTRRSEWRSLLPAADLVVVDAVAALGHQHGAAIAHDQRTVLLEGAGLDADDALLRRVAEEMGARLAPVPDISRSTPPVRWPSSCASSIARCSPSTSTATTAGW